MTTSAFSGQASACGPTFCITRLKTFGRMRCSCIMISFHLMVGGSTSLTCHRGALARVGQGDLRTIQSTCLSSCLESLVRSTTTVLKLLTKQTRPKQRLRAQQARRKHQLTPRQPQLSARPLGFTSATPGVRNITFPPYALNLTLEGHSLLRQAVAPYATHNDGYNTTEYELHNTYGYVSGKATYNALLSVFPGKRPFWIARSTSPGSGAITGHWGGD